jgi:hypothetical protein
MLGAIMSSAEQHGDPAAARRPPGAAGILDPRAFVSLALAALAYSVAMSYLEAAVVVDLRAAMGVPAGTVFPVSFSGIASNLVWIEIGREAATLVMMGGVGWIAGRTPLERLAWTAVVFGVWDIGYYAWLWVFSGWPTGLGSWDLLFLLPVPWAGPVWAPVAVSLGLIAFGLAFAWRLRSGGPLRMDRLRFAVLLFGGLVVVGSFLTNARVVFDGGTPVSFAWPIFTLGMLLGLGAAADALRRSTVRRGSVSEGAR